MDYSLLIGVHNLDVAAKETTSEVQQADVAAQSECSMGEGSTCGANASGEGLGAFERQGSKVGSGSIVDEVVDE